MKKSYITSLILIILGMISFVVSAVGSMHSYVRPDGLLVEHFAQIVIGSMFGFIGIVSGIIIGLSVSIWSLFHNPKKSDTYVFGICIAILIITAGYVSWVYTFNFKNKSTDNNTQVVKQDFSHDGTYTIDGQKVTLKNGFSEIPITPGSTSKIVTKYFGNDLMHDLNGDGKEDKVFIVTQNTGGSGTFYYVVALLDTVQGPVGSSAVLLGDRIAPQTITIDEKGTTNGTNRKNVIVVNYADRKIGENFSIAPSIGKSIWLRLDPKTMQFGEVAQNFEG